MNKLGQVVMQQNLAKGTRRAQLAIDDLQQGTYSIRVYSKGKPQVLQLVVIRS